MLRLVAKRWYCFQIIFISVNRNQTVFQFHLINLHDIRFVPNHMKSLTETTHGEIYETFVHFEISMRAIIELIDSLS